MAINMSVSDSSAKHMVGLNLLDDLIGKHAGSLGDLIFSVVVQTSGVKVDGAEANEDNEGEAGGQNEI